MKRIGILILVVAIVLTATAALPREAPLASPPADASRAATFVGLRDGDTLFVERVRDAPGGFHGEVELPNGSVWIRYRVELGPDESIRRYELDMTSQGTRGPKGIPRPLLVARRTPDSILVEPVSESGIPVRREFVSPGAFIGSTEMAVLEQAIRFALRWNPAGVQFQIYSAWTGKRFATSVDRKSDKVWLTTSWTREKTSAEAGRSRDHNVSVTTIIDAWEFTLDPQNRIVSGIRRGGSGLQADDPWRGLRVVRLDPSGPNPIHRPLTIGESEEGRRRDRLDSRVQTWARQESEFRATLASGLAPQELSASLDRQILAFVDHGGIYQAERCLEAVAAFRSRPGGDALAERYARRAAACADAHDVRLFGERGQIEARVKSRKVLAGILAELGRADSAIVLLKATQELPFGHDPRGLRRDVLIQLGDVLASRSRTDEALETLFDAVAADATTGGICEPLQRSLERVWSRKFPGDTTLPSRMRLAHGLNLPINTSGGSWKETRGVAAPLWSGRDLGGRRHTFRVGRPLVVVFWGSWSEPGLRLVRFAEEWYRRRAKTGVDVVTFDWELAGPGPDSERLARRAVRSENLTVPVLLDHDREIWTRFRVEGLPQVFFVDREGRIARTVFGGAWRVDGLSSWVEALGRDELH